MSNRKELYKEDMYKKLMPTQGMEDEQTGSYYYGDEPPLQRHHAPSVGNSRYINIQEYWVKDKLDLALNKFSCCDCDRCRKEIMALALNELPPRYMVLERDENIPSLTKQELGTISAAIIKAVVTIKANPKHK